MPAMSRAEIDEFLSKPRIGVLCTNDLDGSPNGVPLMERLAGRYWVDEDPAVAAAHAETVESWRQAAAQLRLLTIVPEEIRSYRA